MSENKNINSGKKEDLKEPPEFVVTESALKLQISMEDILSRLVNRTELSLYDDEFYSNFRRFLDLYDRFLMELIYASAVNVVCSAGCSTCCCHWVEDVSSLEGAVIGRYLMENHPDMIDSVISSFRRDEEVFYSLCGLVDEKISEFTSDSDEIPDKYEILLSCFYQLERPCALLDDNGRCVVYPVRPLSCRDYINLRNSAACLPDNINEVESSTLIMYSPDSVIQLLEKLNSRFDECSGDTSLRSLLLNFL